MGEKAPVISEADNTDGFHTFRLMRRSISGSENGSVCVWRDGVSLGKRGFGESSVAGPNGLMVGDSGPFVEGTFDLDYIRLHDEATYPPATSREN